MESSRVIKVKYEETLRRFSARVADGKLSLNLDGLRDKIFQLFNFAPDTELILTYIDEDGDIVTLVDEEDLQDVTRQSLNPLRITVRLNVEKDNKPSATSSENFTPLRPQVHPTFPSINSNVADLQNLFPESEHEKMLKHSVDMAAEVSTTAQKFAEITRALTVIGLSFLKKGSGSQPDSETGSQGPAFKSTTDVMLTNDEPTLLAFHSGKSGKPSHKDKEPFPAADAVDRTSKIAGNLENCTRSIDASKIKSIQPDLNVTPCESLSKGPKPSTSLLDGKKEAGKNFGDCHLVGKALRNSYSNASPTSVPVIKDAIPPQFSPFGSPFKRSHNHGDGTTKVFHRGVCCDGCGVHPITGPRFKSKVKENYDLCSICFEQMGDDADYNRMDLPATYMSGVSCDGCGVHPITVPWFKSKVNENYDLCNKCFVQMGNVADYIRMGYPATYHSGISCDGCGVYPITGPRFKSKVKEDYDLCNICFVRMGNDADYVRMDHPGPCYPPLAVEHGRMQSPTVPQVMRGCLVKPGQPKLDSRFVQDVNVLDGTIMAPSTPFTKIWRMRNNGNVAWPQGTRLVWIGGDKLSEAFPVELQITSVGLAVDQEFDVAVDFTAPELPGKYISYWRMASPSGQKFGQRVWVLIQVDAFDNQPKKELDGEASQYLNLNFPSVSSGAAGPETINVNAEPTEEDIIPEPKLSNPMLVESIVDANQNEQDSKSGLNHSMLTGAGDKSSISASAPGSSISCPIDLTESALAPAVSASSQDVGGNGEVETTLLKELEVMGFKQVDLNKEMLRVNEYDLERAVDDLCGVAEWDPILEELEEMMGFNNKEMNKKLLKKNNGSIKRVVMDLIAGEN